MSQMSHTSLVVVNEHFDLLLLLRAYTVIAKQTPAQWGEGAGSGKRREKGQQAVHE